MNVLNLIHLFVFRIYVCSDRVEFQYFYPLKASLFKIKALLSYVNDIPLKQLHLDGIIFFEFFSYSKQTPFIF